MVSYQQALDIILGQEVVLDTERVPFDKALHRVLAEDVYSDIDMPPFDKAAMDGFACRRNDLGQWLRVVEEVAAGNVPQVPIEPGCGARIMTGAMVPSGADTVIMVEQTETGPGGLIRFTGEKTSANIALKAEDVQIGQKVWDKGQIIRPQHTAIFSSVGYTNPLVYRQPRVGILSTGDELVEPSHFPETGKIRNSNGFQLAAQAAAAHCMPQYLGIVPDSMEATREALDKALSMSDVVLLSGGVSAGDYDFVPHVMREAGINILFQKVEVKPGRPTVFGRKGDVFVFGLPGNPVSSFINFEVMVKPLLYKMMGTAYLPDEHQMKLETAFHRKKTDRPEWLPVTLNSEAKVMPVGYHGSAHIHAICLADGLMFIPKGIGKLEAGSVVCVRKI